jgi:hypothetical protein
LVVPCGSGVAVMALLLRFFPLRTWVCCGLRLLLPGVRLQATLERQN